VTAGVWIVLVALVVSVSQAIVQTGRYYRNRAKADLSAHGLQRHVTTPWSIEKSRGGPIQKDTPDEIVVVNHGPHQATEITCNCPRQLPVGSNFRLIPASCISRTMSTSNGYSLASKARSSARGSWPGTVGRG
jgi:hypothetical protein